MHVIDRISAQEINFNEQYQLYSNNFNLSINECISEVNKHCLKQLLLAFLREGFLSYHYQNKTIIFDLCQSNYFLYVTNVRLFSLLRFNSFDGLILKHKLTALKQTITDPLKLLDIIEVELKSNLNMEQWNKFFNEITNNLKNLLFSIWKKNYLNKLIKEDTQNSKNLLTSILSENKNHSLQFEQLVFKGHPYHPCAKTKIGFSIEDVFNYSPEYCPKVFIFIAAVHKTHLHIEKLKEKPDFSDWFAKHYPDVWENWVIELKRLSINKNDYHPFPIHPWQAKHIIPDLFSDYLKEKIILLFKNVTINMSPTLSFRTLAPLDHMTGPYMKVSVAVQATSRVRTITTASTENTPKITCILEKILKKENYFSERLFILPEYYGLHLKNISDEKSKNFTAIFRENINNYLKKDEISIVVASLFEKISPSNESFFIEILQMAGYLNYKDVLEYFYKYTDTVLSGYLDLYLIYGIALEGHQQNSLVVFNKACIKRIIARDFAGIRVHRPTLERQGFVYKAYSYSPTLTENKDDVRKQLLYTVYQMHLGELILILAEYFVCDEAPFWKIVRDVTCQRFNELKDKLEKVTWQKEYEAILKEDWSLKALLRMRLEKDQSGSLFSSISNPLVT